MPDKRITKNVIKTKKVVGVIHSDASLQSARKLTLEAVDILEIRVDAFAGREIRLLADISKLRLPLIITVRHPEEGGIQTLSTARRRELFRQFLSHASYADVELRSASALRDVIALARKSGVKVIVSHHDFHGTPTLKKLRSLAEKARKAGADIFKIAAITSDATQIATLLSFQDAYKRMPLSLMGMGKFGKVSRLLFAQAGSVLNYGYLGEAQVSGQWPAALLKKRLGELLPD